MLRVLAGFTEQLNNKWLRGSVKDTFTYDVEADWFQDPIVREALYEIDGVVDVMGVALVKEDGLVIPPDWLSHGVKQFISMTRDTSLVCDGYYFGWNVYKFFYKWAEEKGVDVTLLLNDNACLREEFQMSGVLLNTGESFSGNRDMANKILNNRNVILSDSYNGVITARKFKRDDNDKLYTYGKEIKISL